MNRQWREVLGPERYRDFQRVRSPEFKGFAQFGQATNLPENAATRMYQISTEAELRADQIRMGELPDEGRVAALHLIRQQADKALMDVVTMDHFSEFNRHRSYKWVENLESLNPNITSEQLHFRGFSVPR